MDKNWENKPFQSMWIRLRSTTQTKLKKKWNSFLWKWSPYANRLEQNNNKNTSRWHKIAYNWQLSCMGNKTKSHTDWGFFSFKKTCCFNCGCVVRTAIGGIIGRTDWLMEIFYSNSKSTTHLSLSVQQTYHVIKQWVEKSMRCIW